MNYYKIRRAVAEGMGINLYAHKVSATLAVVSDMDLRKVLGFDKSPEEMQEQLGLTPLTIQQMENVKHDGNTWHMYKGE